MNVHSYNDAYGYTQNPSAFQEAYMRGSNIWKDAAHTQPRDCQKFFLRSGLADNWNTLEANFDALPADVKRGFRIISALNVPAGWPSITIREGNNDRTYLDLRTPTARLKMDEEVKKFKERFFDTGRVTWMDIPYPFCPSDEPGADDVRILALGTGDTEAEKRATGRAAYLDAAKWIIDLYVKHFGKAVVGNLGGPSWAAKVLIPYALSKGVRSWRQDSGGYFNWRDEGKEGENRARLYDERIYGAEYLGGRDNADRIIIEVTGNGLTLRNGVWVDQGGKGEPYPMEQMFGNPANGVTGEFYELEITDFGNMGLPSPFLRQTAAATARLNAWYAYIGEPTAPPVEPPPVEPPQDNRYKVISSKTSPHFAVIGDYLSVTEIREDGPREVILFDKTPETIAFLRAVADAMEGK